MSHTRPLLMADLWTSCSEEQIIITLGRHWPDHCNNLIWKPTKRHLRTIAHSKPWCIFKCQIEKMKPWLFYPLPFMTNHVIFHVSGVSTLWWGFFFYAVQIAFIDGEWLDNANGQTCLICCLCDKNKIFFITWCFVGDKPIWYCMMYMLYLCQANKCNVISVYSNFLVLITLQGHMLSVCVVCCMLRYI